VGRHVNGTKTVLLASLLLCSGNTLAQSVDKEPAAVLELGGTADWNVKGGSSFGPTVAVEVTPIENWLELEAGVTPLFTRHSTEWDIDLLFKKPWRLSKKAEFMLGIGPEWVHTTKYGMTTNSSPVKPCWILCSGPPRSIDSAGTLEPGYEYNFGRGHEQSLGHKRRLLIAIP
jgi:hypothetical protein